MGIPVISSCETTHGQAGRHCNVCLLPSCRPPGATNMRLLRLLLAVLVAVPAFAHGQSSAYPNRPIRVVIGYPPGSGVDLVPRYIGERLLASWGQPMVV